MKQAKRIKGVLAPVVTPFKADYSPDPERFLAHCRWLLQKCMKHHHNFIWIH